MIKILYHSIAQYFIKCPKYLSFAIPDLNEKEKRGNVSIVKNQKKGICDLSVF